MDTPAASAMPEWYRPVVAIDIDGVLRLETQPGGEPPEGAYEVTVTVRRDAYPAIYHSPPDWGPDGTATTVSRLSGVGAAWIRSLLDRGIEVVWATTWQQHANTYWAPPLGLPPLPVATTGDEDQHLSSAEWKSDELARAFPGRPLVWIDDSPVDLDEHELAERRRPRDRATTRFHWITHPHRGITTRDIDELEHWLALASTPDGHDELRRQRRNELRQRRRRLDRCRHGSVRHADAWRRAYRLVSRLTNNREHTLAFGLAYYLRDHPHVDPDTLLRIISAESRPADGIDDDTLSQAIIDWASTPRSDPGIHTAPGIDDPAPEREGDT